ncbi:hypothetical protein P4112_14190 [Pseudomonas aeruginosa]|nr:hypothetical protein [Pseudomonas aeruginosa]
MFKDFDACTAWTDAMQERCQPVGLILYQPKRRGSAVRMLWVVTPGCSCLSDAETAADNLLQRITDIAADGRVRYADGGTLLTIKRRKPAWRVRSGKARSASAWCIYR